MLPIIQAFAEGEEVQVLCAGIGWTTVHDLMFSGLPSEYRIKPKPRLWKPYEVPVGALLRNRMAHQEFVIMGVPKDGRDGEVLISSVNKIRHCWQTYTADRYCEFSIDFGQTWKSCLVCE